MQSFCAADMYVPCSNTSICNLIVVKLVEMRVTAAADRATRQWTRLLADNFEASGIRKSFSVL